MDKVEIDNIMFNNFLKSVPTMVVDTKDRKTISAYGSIDVDDLKSAIDRFDKVPDYGELLRENKKQKEVIDKAIEYINKYESIKAYYEYIDEDGYDEYNYDEDFKKELLDILKEVSE